MIDWNIIKQDYVSSRIGYRKLAEKYGIDKGKIQRRGTQEKWPEERKKQMACGTEGVGTAQQQSHDLEDINSRIESLVMMSLDKITCAMKTLTPSDTSALRQLVSTLKDLEEISGAKLGLDLDEWRTRMAMLNKQMNNDEGNETGVVLIPSISSQV